MLPTKKAKEAKVEKEVARNHKAEENHNNVIQPLAVRATKVKAKVRAKATAKVTLSLKAKVQIQKLKRKPKAKQSLRAMLAKRHRPMSKSPK